ncbi:MAG: sulfur carrier protein ThiS [Bacteroidales bacterium]
MIQIYMNNQQKEVADNITLSELLSLLNQPSAGIAVAINQKVIQRTFWNETFLKEHDSVLIIKAACGG